MTDFLRLCWYIWYIFGGKIIASSIIASSFTISKSYNDATCTFTGGFFHPGPQTSKSDSSRLSSGLMFWMWPQWTLDRFEMIILSTSRSKDIREGCLRERIPRLRSHLDPPVVNIYHPKLIFHSALDYAPRATMFLHSSFAQKSS